MVITPKARRDVSAGKGQEKKSRDAGSLGSLNYYREAQNKHYTAMLQCATQSLLFESPNPLRDVYA